MSDWSHLSPCISAGLMRASSSVRLERRIKVIGNAGSQPSDLIVYQVLNPSCDAICIKSGLVPAMPVMGLLAGQEPPLYNETFVTDTYWSHDSSWSLGSGAVATASSTPLVQASSRIVLDLYYLMVMKVTRVSGTVDVYLGSTLSRSFSASGVYATLSRASGSKSISAVPTVFTGTVNYICCVPVTDSYMPCNVWLPMRYSKLSAVGVVVNQNLDTTPGSGLWVGYT